MGKVIAVASGKGGTGKTTAVAALSSCLAVLGYRTLCIDFDAELMNLDLALDMTDFTVMNYMDVVSGRVELTSAISESPRIPNLYFLSAPVAYTSEDEVDKEALRRMFDEVRYYFDFCLVDSPSGIGSGFRLANSNADMSIIVTTGELTSVRDAERTATAVRELGISNLRLLVNRVLVKKYKLIKTTVDDIIDTVGVQLLGLIPEDKNIFLALHNNTPIVLYKKRSSVYDFLDAARRLVGEDIPLQQFNSIIPF